MSATHHPHAYLRPSPHVRKTPVRASRPAQLSKGQGLPKASLKGNTAKSLCREEEIVLDEEDDMGSSFLQYWYVSEFNTLACAASIDSDGQCHVREADRCPQQFNPLLLRRVCTLLMNENSSQLMSYYLCWQRHSCRRKDGCQAPASSPYLPLFSPSLNPYTTGEDSEDILGLKVRSISARQQETDSSLSPRIPPLAHEGKSDLDPSEWKPNLLPRSSSEAFQYLSQFHRSSTSLAPTRRPALQMRRTTASVAITTPSLSHTPTTSTSSDESLAGTPYEFVTRPLLLRHDPTYSASAGTKSVDLVIPHIPSAFSVPVSGIAVDTKLSSTVKKYDLEGTTISGDGDFGKRWVVGNPGPAAGSLKKLLELGMPGVTRIDMWIGMGMEHLEYCAALQAFSKYHRFISIYCDTSGQKKIP